MATNLAGNGQCLGQHSACLIRAALLDADCTPQGGVNAGIVNIGIIDATATPGVPRRAAHRTDERLRRRHVPATTRPAVSSVRPCRVNIIFQD